MAEGEGFEPSIPLSQDRRLANARTRPLCDPSGGSTVYQPPPDATYDHRMSLLDRILGLFRRDPDAPQRLQSPDELTIVARPQGEPEALMIQELLRNEGVHVLVRNRDALSAAYAMAGSALGWEVLVLRRDLRRASELLDLPSEA